MNDKETGINVAYSIRCGYLTGLRRPYFCSTVSWGGASGLGEGDEGDSRQPRRCPQLAGGADLRGEGISSSLLWIYVFREFNHL